MKPTKIGLLGGSFNPAHAGHVHISREALRLLGLHEIWWLVSPQNPLKPTDDMAPFEERFAGAKAITAAIPQIKISAFETDSGTQYTYDTLVALKKSYPDNKFIWLMGADNMVNFHKWHKWREIFSLVPIAVFDRAEYERQAIASEAGMAFKNSRLSKFDGLVEATPPAWSFIHIEKHPASSTQLRKHK
jgi:nicotinate-nucleotide adenylyltransferase